MINTEIDWSQNCLTGGVHNGRSDAIWNIPLLHAAHIFDTLVLQELVISRIYNDAMQFVEHWNEEDPELSNVTHRFAPEWAERVKAGAEERYLAVLAQKVSEIDRYYKSHSFKYDVKDAAERVSKGKLNPHYKPLHDHDSINMLCRIIGSSAARNVA